MAYGLGGDNRLGNGRKGVRHVWNYAQMIRREIGHLYKNEIFAKNRALFRFFCVYNNKRDSVEGPVKRKKITMGGRRKILVIILTVVVVLGAAGGVFSLCRPKYGISESLSGFDAALFDEVPVKISADRKTGRLELQNNASHHIAWDFHTIDIEILLEDGWHELIPTTSWHRGTDIIPKGDVYSVDFEWKKVLGGNLKPGTYRAILYMWKTNGLQWDGFYLVDEFQIG